MSSTTLERSSPASRRQIRHKCGNTLRDQMDVLLAAIEKRRSDGKSATTFSKNDFRRGSAACDWLRAGHGAAHRARCGEFNGRTCTVPVARGFYEWTSSRLSRQPRHDATSTRGPRYVGHLLLPRKREPVHVAARPGAPLGISVRRSQNDRGLVP